MAATTESTTILAEDVATSGVVWDGDRPNYSGKLPTYRAGRFHISIYYLRYYYGVAITEPET